MNETKCRCQAEDSRQVGRIAAYHFFVDVLFMDPHGHWDKERAVAVKTTIDQALRGEDLLRLNLTRKKKPDGSYAGNTWPGIGRRSLGPNLGEFGEGLREGLREIRALVERRHPDRT